MSNQSALDECGEFLMEVRDGSIGFAEQLLSGGIKTSSADRLIRALGEISEDQRQAIRAMMMKITDVTIHRLCSDLEWSEKVRLLVMDANGVEVDVAKDSDGLASEVSREKGWRERFSEYEVEID